MKHIWDYDPEKVVANAKQQVANARIMGQFTVQMGSAELARRAQELQVLLRSLCEDAGLIAKTHVPEPEGVDSSPPPEVEAPVKKAPAKKTSAKKTPAKKTPAKKTPAKKTPAKKTSAKTTSAKTTSAKTTSAKTTSARKIPAQGAELALRDYDTLAASQIVPRLGSLSKRELEAIRAHELANRSRKTILGRIAQLQS